MPPLLHDRFLMLDAAHACDLATGEVVEIAGLEERRSTYDRSMPGLLEVLEHGRDGEPRAIVADIRAAVRWRTAADRIAGEAASRGYVPIEVGLYTRLRAVMQD